ncbi:MAG TPA: hypothetical protein VFO76_07135 [Candidatus Kapabacteria bacterium]|nr:hypothetical protein [Candidatus Kapabacteria bacterium]
MTVSEIIGSVGVLLLLVAYFLALFKFLTTGSKAYGILNMVGAALACYASVMIGYIPFVILEGIWALVALIGLFRKSGTKK